MQSNITFEIVDTRKPPNLQGLIHARKKNLASWELNTREQKRLIEIYDLSENATMEEIYNLVSVQMLKERGKVWKYLRRVLLKEDKIEEPAPKRFYDPNEDLFALPEPLPYNEQKEGLDYSDEFLTRVARMIDQPLEDVRPKVHAILKDDKALSQFYMKQIITYEVVNLIQRKDSDSYENDTTVRDLYYLLCRINGVLYGSIAVYHVPGTDYLYIIHIAKTWAGIFAELIWTGQFPKLNSLLIPEIETIARNFNAKYIYVVPIGKQGRLLERYYGFQLVRKPVHIEGYGIGGWTKGKGQTSVYVKELLQFEGI